MRRKGRTPFFETLEGRQLLSASVDNSTLYFSNAKATGNPASAPRLVTLTNTGNSSIHFTSATLTGNTTEFAISSAPTANTTIAPGGNVTVGITFTAPSGTTGVTLYTSGLTINTDDATDASLPVNLRAFALTGYQGGPEPSLGQIVDTLYQIPVTTWNAPSNINSLTLPYQLNGAMTVPYGEEVVAQAFVKASSAPVTVQPLVTFGPAAASPNGGTDYTWGYYTPGQASAENPVYSATTPVGSPTGGDGQTANPIAHPVSGDTVSTDGKNIVTFDPGSSAFGLYTFFPVVSPNLTAYSEDPLNSSIPINNIANQTRRIRFWPNKTSDGTVIPHSYIGAVEEAANNDIQDVVFIVNNVDIANLATKLAFTQSPTNASAGAIISPAVTVAVEDAAGTLQPGDSSTITLTLNQGTFAGGGNTTTAVASGGIATFGNLTINAAGNYTLTAADGNLTSATSNTFTVNAANPLTTIDDTNSNNTGLPQVTYTFGNGTAKGNWSSISTTISGALDKTVTNSGTTNDKASVTFNGTQIVFWSGEKDTRGIAAVSIDGGAETMVDTFLADPAGSTGVSTVAYTSPILTPGTHTLTVRVTGTHDSHGNTTATVSIDRFDIYKAVPSITWSNPANIVYGTALSATQLNATAFYQSSAVAGNFSYSPGNGTVLNAGANQSLGVTFTPADSLDYILTNANATLNVLAANSTTTLSTASGSTNPAPFGQPVTCTATVAPVSPATATPTGSVQFKIDGVNAGTPVTLSSGTANSAPVSNLTSGNHQITAIYTPDTGNFNNSTSSVFTQKILTTISSWSVNLGAVQRSMVIGLTANFTQKITSFDPGAFTLQTSTGGAVAATITPTPSQDGLSISLAFSGTGVTGNSLPNGRYVITAHGSLIHDASGSALPADQTFSFFRLYGDINGDASVNGTDYRAFFASYLQSSPNSAYDPAFDWNNDGTVNGTDYRQFFADYLTSI